MEAPPPVARIVAALQSNEHYSNRRVAELSCFNLEASLERIRDMMLRVLKSSRWARAAASVTGTASTQLGSRFDEIQAVGAAHTFLSLQKSPTTS